ncbi:hypothetical protein LCGC14_1421570 [marine sediment metagenome]|uniref:GtrA-like protein domain-containing protein n=1 Tax=marine sediment metagenome TaxID=412755 RepID=A0A0F9JRR8_9ZZZZ
MLIIGGVVWAVYILFLNAVYWLGFSYEFASVIGIPFSWVLNYTLNTSLNFEQSFQLKRFASFAVVSGIGWLLYLITLFFLVEVAGVQFFAATILSIISKTVSNVIFQQAVTFGWLGEAPHSSDEPVPVSADYDWNAYYHGNLIQKWWKRRLANIVFDMVAAACGSRLQLSIITDLGCGSSPILMLIPSRIKRGLELSQEKVGFMRERDISSTYVQGRAEDTRFDSESSDVTLCIEVLEHHPKPHLLIAEIARITADGGTVIIATPDFATPLWNIVEVFYGLLMRKGYHGEHDTKFTESSVIALAYANGLAHQETRSILGADKIMRFKKIGTQT